MYYSSQVVLTLNFYLMWELYSKFQTNKIRKDIVSVRPSGQNNVSRAVSQNIESEDDSYESKIFASLSFLLLVVFPSSVAPIIALWSSA